MFKNDFPNGTGIAYDSTGRKIFQGSFVNGSSTEGIIYHQDGTEQEITGPGFLSFNKIINEIIA